MQAVFDFEPSLPDELPLRQGDTVRVEHLVSPALNKMHASV